ncbi:hypothetical protein NDI44_28235 [Trichocoleus sp. DQ-A3]|uniref:hypothetical protein n=1 Tax=Cyanophyceae TaxID=3028117 RepID=UPI001682CC24|nr:hypothetical protein [Coleofasciculus sp. FACHB-125]MBD1903639.1 hypothetical protein [Coleofasciculus sp. FACHB-125]
MDKFIQSPKLNSPDVDPSRGLINLPTAPVDTWVSTGVKPVQLKIKINLSLVL